jgi:hypothetical protein
MSDIPGFGVGALEHVYYRLRDFYPGECEPAPFVVVTEAASLSKLTDPGQAADSALPDEMRFILRSQLLEGDLIVLNKTDLYTDEEKDRCLSVIRGICPDTPVLEVSARTGAGIPALAEYLMSHVTGYPEPDLGVTEEEFDAAFGKLSMYNCQYYAEVCCDDFDADDYLTELAETVRTGLADAGYDVPHLKLFAQRENGDYCKVDLLGVNRGVILTHAMEGRCTDLPVVINTTSAADAAYLAGTIDKAVIDVSGRYDLSVVIFYKECFGLNDEDRM